jgi:hypothetical protein
MVVPVWGRTVALTWLDARFNPGGIAVTCTAPAGTLVKTMMPDESVTVVLAKVVLKDWVAESAVSRLTSTPAALPN